MKLKRTLICLSLVTGLQLASAQERLSREETLKYAFLVSADLKQLQGTPIPTDVDLKRPVAMRDGEFGGMILPEARLSAEAIAKAGDKVMAVGQLWLLKLTPMHDGNAISESQLRVIKLSHEGDEVQVPQCALGVRRAASGGLELLVYGKAAEPLFAVPLKAIDGKEQPGIDLDADRDSSAGHLTLTLAGKYRAKLDVTQLEL